MKRPAMAVLLCASLLAGCSARARFYPVRGPLSSRTPSPVYVGRLSGITSSGTFSVVLDDGEVCKGHWAQVPRPSKSSDGAASAAPGNLGSEWDLVYGQGFYVANVLGARLYATAEMTGNRGTVLHAELYKPDKVEQQPVSNIKGVAKDDKGNVYKIAF